MRIENEPDQEYLQNFWNLENIESVKAVDDILARMDWEVDEISCGGNSAIQLLEILPLIRSGRYVGESISSFLRPLLGVDAKVETLWMDSHDFAITEYSLLGRKEADLGRSFVIGKKLCEPQSKYRIILRELTDEDVTRLIRSEWVDEFRYPRFIPGRRFLKFLDFFAPIGVQPVFFYNMIDQGSIGWSLGRIRASILGSNTQLNALTETPFK